MLDASFYRDPYPAYDKLRCAAPVLKVDGIMGPLPTWVITGHAEARVAFTHPGISKDTRRFGHLLSRGEKKRDLHPAVATTMVATDPPDHTRLRRLVTKAFTPATAGKLRPRIQQITSTLLDAIEPDGAADLIASVAIPLPVTVISELLGVPEPDRPQLHRWSSDNFAAGDSALRDAASHKVVGYMTSLVAVKRTRPGDDLLSDLTKVRDTSGTLTENELISLAVLLLIAGHETTTSLIGNALLALLLHPGQLAELRAHPALIPAAIEEILRYDSPVAIATIRFTAEPITIGNVTIPAGQVVLISPAAANHDPARYLDPASLDIHRDNTSHLSFGHGIHHCLGAQLARTEAEIAIAAVLTRLPGLNLGIDPADLQWRRTRLIRSVQSLPVRWSVRTGKLRF